MRIDVYDFDGTIYDGDSTVDFTRFCLRRHPAVLAGLRSDSYHSRVRTSRQFFAKRAGKSANKPEIFELFSCIRWHFRVS